MVVWDGNVERNANGLEFRQDLQLRSTLVLFLWRILCGPFGWQDKVL